MSLPSGPRGVMVAHLLASQRGQLFFKLFRPLVKCSISTLGELSGQGSLMTEGVVDKPVEFRELDGM